MMKSLRDIFAGFAMATMLAHAPSVSIDDDKVSDPPPLREQIDGKIIARASKDNIPLNRAAAMVLTQIIREELAPDRPSKCAYAEAAGTLAEYFLAYEDPDRLTLENTAFRIVTSTTTMIQAAECKKGAHTQEPPKEAPPPRKPLPTNVERIPVGPIMA